MGHSYTYPRRIRKGDKIGVFAPSSPLAARFPKRLRAGIEAIAALWEVEVVVADQAQRHLDGHQAGGAAERARAFMEFACDPEIAAIVATIGGYNSAEILPHLNKDVLRQSPKILLGYSDVTALLLGIQAMAGWITFHGPTVMTDFGEMPGIHPFTARYLMRAVASGHGGARWLLDDPDQWTDEFVDWGGPDWQRGRVSSGPGHRTVLTAGKGSGTLFGGNISTLNYLVGTPYLDPPADAVFFFEATGPDATLAAIQRSLTHLRHAGILDSVRAVLIGRSPQTQTSGGRLLQHIVSESLPNASQIPIIADLPFGHVSPIWTLPLGVEVSVWAGDDESAIEICGDTTSEVSA